MIASNRGTHALVNVDKRVFLTRLRHLLFFCARHRRIGCLVEHGRHRIRALQDIRRTLVSAQQIRAFSCCNICLQCLHPRQQPDQIVLATKAKHGINQIMPHTRFALLDFEAVDEKFFQQGRA